MNGEPTPVPGDPISEGRIQSSGKNGMVTYETLRQKDGQGLDLVIYRVTVKRHDGNARDNVRFDVLGSPAVR